MVKLKHLPENDAELFKFYGQTPPVAPPKRNDPPEVRLVRDRYYQRLEKSLFRLHKLEDPKSNPHVEQSRKELVSIIKQYVKGKRGA